MKTYWRNLYQTNPKTDLPVINKRKQRLVVLCTSIIILSICSLVTYCKLRYTPYLPKNPTQIFLYGESHGEKELMDKEFELWKEHYEKDGMRYLFVEHPYYTAEFLNLWMQSYHDDLLDYLYEAWKGVPTRTPYIKEFYRKIKHYCPKTIFCGTDVGHQYTTIGNDYLIYLRNTGKENSEEYQTTLNIIHQGEYYYETFNEIYREDAMTKNFIKLYDSIVGSPIMGIYGNAHTDPRKENYNNQIDSMAKQLKTYYGDIIEYHMVSKL